MHLAPVFHWKRKHKNFEEGHMHKGIRAAAITLIASGIIAGCGHETRTIVRKETVQTVPAPVVVERRTTVEEVPAAPTVQEKTTTTYGSGGTVQQRTRTIETE
jgi:hypothetical protein